MLQRLPSAYGLHKPLRHSAFAIPRIPESVAIAHRFRSHAVFSKRSREVGHLNANLRHAAAQIRNHTFAFSLVHLLSLQGFYLAKVLRQYRKHRDAILQVCARFACWGSFAALSTSAARLAIRAVSSSEGSASISNPENTVPVGIQVVPNAACRRFAPSGSTDVGFRAVKAVRRVMWEGDRPRTFPIRRPKLCRNRISEKPLLTVAIGRNPPLTLALGEFRVRSRSSANTTQTPCITKGMGKCPENVAG